MVFFHDQIYPIRLFGRQSRARRAVPLRAPIDSVDALTTSQIKKGAGEPAPFGISVKRVTD